MFLSKSDYLDLLRFYVKKNLDVTPLILYSDSIFDLEDGLYIVNNGIVTNYLEWGP